MPAPAIVTIILVVVVVLVLAAFLLGIARILVDVNKRLGTVINAVGSIADATQPVDSVVRSINGNLATARDVLSSLLESKVGAAGAAELVASVDPLAEDPEAMLTPYRYERAYDEEEPAAAPPWGDVPAGDPSSRIQYERAVVPPDSPAPEPSTPEPAPAPEPAPDPQPGPAFRPAGAGGGNIRFHDEE